MEQQLPANYRALMSATGFATSKVLHALIKLNVIECLGDNEKSLQEIATSCALNEDILRRVLRYAISFEFIKLNNNKYSLRETGRYLLKGVPGSIALPVMLMGEDPWQKSWSNLAHCLQTGEPAFDTTMGSPFFDYLENHAGYGQLFNQWMTVLSQAMATPIAEAYDFLNYKTVCDVGGGQGYLLKVILELNPHLKGVLFDLDSVTSNNVLNDLNERVKVLSGNFFESIPAADIIMMKQILHDWSDENCLKILSSCRKALNSPGKLLIIEQVLDEPPTSLGVFYDLHMQVLLGGKERTENEFRVLLDKAGFTLSRIIHTNAPLKIIEASP